jgi:RNA polymerase sigma-70 factor (ECF subfamily)
MSYSQKIDTDETDVALQRCLNRLAGAADDSDTLQIARELLSVAAGRILSLCGSMLRRQYPRLAKGPFNVQPEDLVGAVVERLITAMRNVRPAHVREFFALTMTHIRWELNGLVREFDAQTCERLRSDVIAGEPEVGEEQFSPLGHRILKAVQGLAQSDQEIFNLVRLHGMTQSDAADVLGISVRTVERRLKRILPRLWGELGGLQPPHGTEPQRNRMLPPPSFVTAAAVTGEPLPRHAA